MSASGMVGAAMAALLTRASIRPKAFSTASNMAITSASTETSPLIATALPPAFSISATAAVAAAASFA